MKNFKNNGSEKPCYYISVPNNSHFSKMKVKKWQGDGDYEEYLRVREKKNADVLCDRLNDVIFDYFHKEAKPGKRTLFHITMSPCSHFLHLTCKKVDNVDPTIKESYKECIYFEENEREKARCVLHEIKSCIYEFFHSSDEGEAGKDYPSWITEAWRDDCDCK